MTERTKVEVLLVEDNAAHVELIRRALTDAEQRFSLQTADTLRSAYELLDGFVPALAIIDMNLPDGCGLELLDTESLRSAVPVIIMTSFGKEQDAVAAIKTGAIDYIVKSDVTFLDMGHIVERSLREWQNILKRKATEEALHLSEQKFRALSREFQAILQGISETLFLVDREMRVIWHNSGEADDLSADAHFNNADTARTCFSLLCNASHPCRQCPVPICFETGKNASAIIETSPERTLDVKAFPLMNEEGEVDRAIVLAGDITEKQRFHAEAIRAGQLASIGELAAGVAHEINNPLNGMINYAQLITDSEDASEAVQQLSGGIIEEGRRIAHIVRNLLSFAREPMGGKQQVGVREIVDASMALTDSQLSRNGICVKLEIDDTLPPIYVNKRQIQQVILNLLSNSRYALNERYPGDDPRKRIEIVAKPVVHEDQDWVRMTVTDYGTGIPEHALNKIMNPFFSTKPRDKGTGLGMSISYGIMKNQDGRMSVDSHFGEYTRVTLDLPVTRPEDVSS